MGKIQSDASVASASATSIQSGASGITAVGKATKDSDSQYSGQTSAASYIDSEASKSTSIAGKLTEFIGLIHSTASEFEAVDQKLSKSISTPNQYLTSPATTPPFQPKPYFK
ncbi:TIGR04197 family type VII secretion effector [Streptococcus parauberis]|uniref:TIGR04197 family type VII secretion effector n=1 Tax=Streptococcus parauberis TaxID=1348 RepID=UPI003787E816